MLKRPMANLRKRAKAKLTFGGFLFPSEGSLRLLKNHSIGNVAKSRTTEGTIEVALF
ncbi:MAG: hypothetical protein ACTS6G_03040 [Candidatus Hodgkinia cicadicola]